MELHGKIIDLGNGKAGFEYIDSDFNHPNALRQVWPIVELRTRGMSYCRIDEAFGKPATITDGRVSCYLGQGNYVEGALPQLGSTKAITQETFPIPCPKCRVETRYYNGQWQKTTRKGWVAITDRLGQKI